MSSWTTYRPLHAQGATEYLVLLAVVLIIALVAIALLGFFPGLSNDAKYTQNRAYWESAAPIAIVDGVAADEASFLPTAGVEEGQDAVLLTIKNNGGSAVELLYVTFGGNAHYYDLADYPSTIVEGHATLIGPSTGGDYMAYVAPPRGSGYGAYETPIILQPGETATVGVSVVGANDPLLSGLSGTYPSQVCRKSNEASVGRTFDAKNFIIAYSVITEGFKTYKYQKGELILRCIPDLGV